MMSDNLRGKLQWIVLPVHHIPHRLRFIRTSNEHRRMPRRQKHARQQGDSPGIQLRYLYRRNRVLTILDQRLARKEARSVSVRPHAEVHDIEVRQLAFFQ